MSRARVAGVAASHPAKRATCTAAAALAAPGAALTFRAADIAAIASTALVPVARTAAATAHATSAAPATLPSTAAATTAPAGCALAALSSVAVRAAGLARRFRGSGGGDLALIVDRGV